MDYRSEPATKQSLTAKVAEVAARLVTFPEAHFEVAHISPFILSMSAPELCTPRAFKICAARFRRMMSTAAVTPKITRSRIVILHWFPATRAMSGRQYVLAFCNRHLSRLCEMVVQSSVFTKSENSCRHQRVQLPGP